MLFLYHSEIKWLQKILFDLNPKRKISSCKLFIKSNIPFIGLMQLVFGVFLSLLRTIFFCDKENFSYNSSCPKQSVQTKSASGQNWIKNKNNRTSLFLKVGECKLSLFYFLASELRYAFLLETISEQRPI